MFKHLLIPLDGTPMSEQVLPVSALLAEMTGAQVTLLHLLEPAAPRTVHGQRHLTGRQEAEDYLREIARRAFPPRVKVGWHVHPQRVGRVARGVTFHADEMHPDLIVMCAHGGVRLRDRLLGNLAQQVLHELVTPILLVHPPPRGEAGFPFRQVLVPLDGQADHEHGLPPAQEMARLCRAPILLATVVPTSAALTGHQAATAAMLPGATQKMLEISEQQAVEYLQGHAGRLNSAGVQASGRVDRGDPAKQILQAARQSHTDLIVLGTHGKAGTDAFWSGSLTPKLLRHAKASFLLVPVPKLRAGKIARSLEQ